MNYTLAIDNIETNKFYSDEKFDGKIRLVPMNRTILAKKPNKDALNKAGKALSNVVKSKKNVENVEQVQKIHERRKDVVYINLPAVVKLKQKIAKMPLAYSKLMISKLDNINMPSSMNIEGNLSKEDIQPEVKQPIDEAIAPVAVEKTKEPSFEKYEMPTAISEEPIAMVSEPTEAPSLTKEVSNTVATEIPAPVYQEDVAEVQSINSEVAPVDKEEVHESQINSMTSGSSFVPSAEPPSIVSRSTSEEELQQIALGVSSIVEERDKAVANLQRTTAKYDDLQKQYDASQERISTLEDTTREMQSQITSKDGQITTISDEYNSYRETTSRALAKASQTEAKLADTEQKYSELEKEYKKVFTLYANFAGYVKNEVEKTSHTNERTFEKAA